MEVEESEGLFLKIIHGTQSLEKPSCAPGCTHPGLKTIQSSGQRQGWFCCPGYIWQQICSCHQASSRQRLVNRTAYLNRLMQPKIATIPRLRKPDLEDQFWNPTILLCNLEQWISNIFFCNITDKYLRCYEPHKISVAYPICFYNLLKNVKIILSSRVFQKYLIQGNQCLQTSIFFLFLQSNNSNASSCL